MLSSNRAVFQLLQRTHVAVIPRFASAVATNRRSEPVTEAQLKMYPVIGQREIVGFGRNGRPQYFDDVLYPYPSIRYKETTPQIEQLVTKEAGDWKALSVDEVKALYRASFGQTFAEITAPTGRWKMVFAWYFAFMAAAGFVFIIFRKAVYGPLPHTFTQEHADANLWKQVMLKEGHINGVASKFDYEKMRWKE